MREEGSEKRKANTEFCVNRSHFWHATDSIDEYEALTAMGEENIIFTNRAEVEKKEDTDVYDGTAKCHHVFAERSINEGDESYKISMRDYPSGQANFWQYKEINGCRRDFNRHRMSMHYFVSPIGSRIKHLSNHDKTVELNTLSNVQSK